jgi:hypothetical protein
VDKSPTFRADVGFEPSNNSRQASANIGGIKRFDDSKILENINGGVDVAMKWNYDDVKKDEWVDASWEIKFRAAQTGIHSRYMRSNELFGGVQFDDIWQAHTCLHTQPYEQLSLGGNANYGHRIARGRLVMGKEIQWGLWADIKPIDRLMISSSFNDIASDDLDTGEDLFSQSVFRTRMSLQFSREFSTRLVVQYNDSANAWDVDPLLTYQINPLTVLYVGSTHDFRDLTLEDDGRTGWEQTGRQYFLKLQYLFQL